MAKLPGVHRPVGCREERRIVASLERAAGELRRRGARVVDQSQLLASPSCLKTGEAGKVPACEVGATLMQDALKEVHADNAKDDKKEEEQAC